MSAVPWSASSLFRAGDDRFADAIRREDLIEHSCRYVQLSADADTTTNVGAHHADHDTFAARTGLSWVGC
jgi:RNA:NAD 2'-phosphotransferase (TPT1/KptA family)